MKAADVPDLLAVIGVASVVVGIGWVYLPAGVIVAGCALLIGAKLVAIDLASQLRKESHDGSQHEGRP